MPIEIKAYLCEHGCGKVSRHKSSMSSHEKRCWWNPERQACASCGYQDEERCCQVYGLDLTKKAALRSGCLGWKLGQIDARA